MSIFVDEKICNSCGTAEEPFCVMTCPGDLMFLKENRKADVRPAADCWDCAVCVKHCPVGAIELRLPLEISEAGTALRARAIKTRTRWSLEYPDGRVEDLDIPIADTRDPNITLREEGTK
ncbi:MAG: 4Fe-4S dicluster domain-containing protein [Bdellovibrionota bacterium]